MVVIESGGIKTNWGHIAVDQLAESAKGGDYDDWFWGQAIGLRVCDFADQSFCFNYASCILRLTNP